MKNFLLEKPLTPIFFSGTQPKYYIMLNLGICYLTECMVQNHANDLAKIIIKKIHSPRDIGMTNYSRTSQAR